MAKRETKTEAAPSMGDLTIETRPIEGKAARPEELEPAKPQDAGVDREVALLERERRRYVKAGGGLRKNLNPKDIEKANRLCDTLDCPAEKGWMPIYLGEEVLGPGRVFDNIDRTAVRHREWNEKDKKGPK